MEEYAKKVREVAATLERLEITATFSNMDRLLGCQMALRQLAAELEAKEQADANNTDE